MRWPPLIGFDIYCFTSGFFSGPDLKEGVSGRAVARLVEGDPFVGQRVIDFNPFMDHFLTIFQYNQITVVIFGALTVGVITDIKIITADGKPEINGFDPILRANLIDGIPLDNIDVGFVSPDIANNCSGHNDQDREMGHVGPKAGIDPFLGKQIEFAIFFGTDGFGKLFFQQGGEFVC